MDDLIEALTIFRKYSNEKWPTSCNHDELSVFVDPDVVSDDDKKRLEELSFKPDDCGGFVSFRFGSC